MLRTLTGQNGYLLGRALKDHIDAFLKEHGDFGLQKIDGEEAGYDRMREALQSLPFLAPKSLVVLRGPSAQKDFQEKFESLLPTIPDETDVIIVEPKLDKRTVYFKTLKKLTDFKEFNELDVPALAQWLGSEAKTYDGTISRADAQYLVERVGLNQQNLSNELQKLILYAPTVTRETIDVMTERTPQSTVFDLLDAALNGRKKLAMTLYDEQRIQKVEPQAMIGLLSWQLHVLALITTAQSSDPNAIASAAKISPYTVRKSQGIARSLGLQGVKRLVRDLKNLDTKLKTKTINADDALRAYLLAI